MIQAEIAQNPVLEECGEGGEELTPEELQPLLEAEGDGGRSRRSIDSRCDRRPGGDRRDGRRIRNRRSTRPRRWLSKMRQPSAGRGRRPSMPAAAADAAEIPEAQAPADPVRRDRLRVLFRRLSGSRLQEPRSEDVEKPSFETFLSSPVTLSDHLHSQLALVALPRGGPRRRRWHHRQSGRERLSDSRASEEIALPRGPHAARTSRKRSAWCRRSIRRAWLRGSARVPAAADRKPQRQGRRGLADRLRSPEAGGTPAAQGTGARAASAAWSTSRSRWT